MTKTIHSLTLSETVPAVMAACRQNSVTDGRRPAFLSTLAARCAR
jgi:hypothetical protein